MSTSRPGAVWANDPGKKLMMNFISNPLASTSHDTGGYHLAGGVPVMPGKQRELPTQASCRTSPWSIGADCYY